MAHPKRKISKSRRDKRRTHYKSAAATLATCSNCNSSVRYHRVCPDCGYYKGKPAVEKSVSI
ncbi:MAG: 50S ribosomal protein L32 [Flavobacteriales bacterium]|nr:50S ribosomal protein L32 [Flavobacteriales bacterium]